MAERARTARTAAELGLRRGDGRDWHASVRGPRAATQTRGSGRAGLSGVATGEVPHDVIGLVAVDHKRAAAPSPSSWPWEAAAQAARCSGPSGSLLPTISVSISSSDRFFVSGTFHQVNPKAMSAKPANNHVVPAWPSTAGLNIVR